MGTIGDSLKAKSKEVSSIVNEVSIFKNLIRERAHPLDLIRELLSNAGAVQVRASRIEISYTQDKDGHIFEVADDGCGMTYTGDSATPGRLDKFIGLGLSGIVGIQSDEFSWKGLGSKLSYQSRRVEIETCTGGRYPMYDVRVIEPWQTLDNNNVPKPRISEYPAQSNGTRIRVVGHPPHRKEQPFSFDELKTYLLHRTFAGFTRDRENAPEIMLSVLGRTERLQFGFPEFSVVDFAGIGEQGLRLDEKEQTLFINMLPKSSKSMKVVLKGFLTWNPDKYGLSANSLNTGLILSVRGIPYFALDMEEYGSMTIRTARPGVQRTCLVAECDAIQDEMNISRSALVDSPKTVDLRKMLTELFQRVESSEAYLAFRRLPETEKVERQGDVLAQEKRAIEQPEQNWVVLDRAGELTVLLREPKNETEVNAIIWKLEALKALPFETFDSLSYVGAFKGPDLLVNFREDKSSEPFRAAIIEVENNFYNYKTHGHTPAQYPKVVCWDVPTSGRKAKINKTQKPFKFTYNAEEYQVHIFAIKYMEGIKVMSRAELQTRGIQI